MSYLGSNEKQFKTDLNIITNNLTQNGCHFGKIKAQTVTILPEHLGTIPKAYTNKKKTFKWGYISK